MYVCHARRRIYELAVSPQNARGMEWIHILQGEKGWNIRVGGPTVRPSEIRERHPDTEAEVDFRKHRILLHFRWRGFGWTIWRGRERMETERAGARGAGDLFIAKYWNTVL